MNKHEIEVAPVSADIRIGSVVELEDRNSYEVASVEEKYDGKKIQLILKASDRKAAQKLCFRQIVVTYGQTMKVCEVNTTAWENPHVTLKEV